MLKSVVFILLCTYAQAVNHVVDGWTPQGNPFTPIEAIVGDTVTFIWTGNHNVHKLILDDCATSTENMIVSVSDTAILISASDAGSSFIFACGVANHCERGQKVQVVVQSLVTTPTPTPPPSLHIAPTSAGSTTPTSPPSAQITPAASMAPTPPPSLRLTPRANVVSFSYSTSFFSETEIAHDAL